MIPQKEASKAYCQYFGMEKRLVISIFSGRFSILLKTNKARAINKDDEKHCQQLPKKYSLTLSLDKIFKQSSDVTMTFDQRDPKTIGHLQGQGL